MLLRLLIWFCEGYNYFCITIRPPFVFIIYSVHGQHIVIIIHNDICLELKSARIFAMMDYKNMFHRNFNSVYKLVLEGQSLHETVYIFTILYVHIQFEGRCFLLKNKLVYQSLRGQCCVLNKPVKIVRQCRIKVLSRRVLSEDSSHGAITYRGVNRAVRRVYLCGIIFFLCTVTFFKNIFLAKSFLPGALKHFSPALQSDRLKVNQFLMQNDMTSCLQAVLVGDVIDEVHRTVFRKVYFRNHINYSELVFQYRFYTVSK